MAVEVQKDILTTLGMDFINFKVIGILFQGKGPEYEFFKNEIENEGLTGFSVSIKSRCSEDKKREIVRNLIATWDDKGTPITEL